MTELVDYKILSLYMVFGFFIILGYGIMVKKYWRKGTSSDIWTNKGINMITKKSSLKYAYMLMILLSTFLAGPYLIYYLTTTTKSDTNEILIYVGSVIFLVCSAIWAFFPFEYNRIILGLVAVGAILILTGIALNSEDPNDPKKAIALAAISILVVQTFFFDFFIWTGILFGKKK
jgi:hypothetical protein